MTSPGKQISNPFSTGGGGVNFETQVQALFAAMMLAGGFAPCLPCRPIQKLIVQGRVHGYETDDLIVFTLAANGSQSGKLLVQIKYSIAITEGNDTFRDVIAAAWRDFQNAKVFTRKSDAIALVTGPLSATDISDVRAILEWARHSAAAAEFFNKVETTNFSSDAKRNKLKAFRVHVESAEGKAVSNQDLFDFLRHFHLLGYDLDVRSGTMHALVHSVIGRHAPASAAATWARVVQEMASANQNAGTVTAESFSDDLRNAFLPVVQQTIPTTIASSLPPTKASAWNNAEFGPALTVASLLGGWDENSDADMTFVADLTKADPMAWLRTMREVLQLPDAPIRQQAGVWSIRDRGDLWQRMGPRVFDEHLKAIRDLSSRVLGERDPRFDLEANERFAASIYGKTPEHSGSLRHGLAETLALLGARSASLVNCSVGAADAAAAVAVRTTLKSDDWVAWASVNDLLPLLAEASPAEFLNAVERAISADPCPLDQLFAQEGGGIGGSNYMTGVLWAMETLAWEEQYLVRATSLLGALAARDPGGQWANRPANSLTTIFLPWLPQTLASGEKKTVAIRTLLQEHPDVGAKLLLSLMPKQTSMSTGSRKPQWRAILPDGELPRPTTQAYWDAVVAYADMAADLASGDPKLLLQLVDHLDTLPPPTASRVLSMMSSADVVSLPEEDRFGLWVALSSIARKHRRFHDADWAMPPERVEELDVAADKIVPKRPEIRHRVLFSGDDWDLYDGDDDWKEQEKALEERRREALTEIHADGGADGVIAFAEAVDSPIHVGYSFAWVDGVALVPTVLPDLLRDESAARQQFADGYVRGCLRRGGWEWVDSLDTSRWTADDVARFLMSLPFQSETWTRVEHLLGGDASVYWRNVNVNPYQSSDGLGVAIERLMDVGRPRAAIDCLARQIRDGAPVNGPVTIDALLAAIGSDEPIYSLHSHHVTSLIEALQQAPEAPKDRLLQVEWAYLPLLDRYGEANPRTLEMTLASDPEFFSSIIRMVYRSKNDDADEPSEDKKALAQNAYRLLQEWKTVPGSGANGEFCGADLESWMASVKQSAEGTGHLGVALHQAGSVLIHSPKDPEGLWMHRSVAALLNREEMVELRRGYSLATYNSRGVHWVDPTGAPEKRLAEDYDHKAESIENAGYHRLAATLREIADTYRREAEQIMAESRSEQSPGDPE